MGIERLFGENVEIVHMPEPTRDSIKKVIEKRIRFAEEQTKIPKDHALVVDESAYDTIFEISRNSIGLALLLLRLTLENRPIYQGKPPYRLTSDHVRSMGFTYESLAQYWDSQLRDATIIHM